MINEVLAAGNYPWEIFPIIIYGKLSTFNFITATQSVCFRHWVIFLSQYIVAVSLKSCFQAYRSVRHLEFDVVLFALQAKNCGQANICMHTDEIHVVRQGLQVGTC